MSQPTVAILGASTDRSKFGNIAVRAHVQQGYKVYPINPRADNVEGLKSYGSLSEIPESRLDRISVYVPPAAVLSILDDIAKMPHDQLWLNPGTESEEVLERAGALQLDPIQACSIVDLGIRPNDV
jgi:predicted CoA-binding protein